jgi:HTH-type transcriptional regulator / antitoxin HigA
MKSELLKTKEEYQEALKRLEQIFDASSCSLESQEADVLAALVDDYEKKDFKF